MVITIILSRYHCSISIIYLDFQCIFSSTVQEYFDYLVKFYIKTDTYIVKAESHLWKTKLSRLETLPNSGIDTIKLCYLDIICISNIYKLLLKIFCTIHDVPFYKFFLVFM